MVNDIILISIGAVSLRWMVWEVVKVWANRPPVTYDEKRKRYRSARMPGTR